MRDQHVNSRIFFNRLAGGVLELTSLRGVVVGVTKFRVNPHLFHRGPWSRIPQRGIVAGGESNTEVNGNLSTTTENLVQAGSDENAQAACAHCEPSEDASTCGCSSTHGYMGDKQGYLRRLKRIEGQARGLHRMVEEEKYCIDILTQIAAVNKALQAVALGLLEDHMTHCVLAAAQADSEEGEAKLQEATEAIARLLRS